MKFELTRWKRLFARKTVASATRNPAASPHPMAIALQALVNAPTREEKKALLKAHPQLVSLKVEEILSLAANKAASERERHVLEQNRLLLQLCREVGVDAAFTPIPDTPPGTPVGFVVQAFLNTPGLEKKKTLLKSHPELLGPEAEEVLARSVIGLTDEGIRTNLDSWRRVLGLCRQVGIDAAFAEVERRNRKPPLDADVCQHLIKLFWAATPAELEALVRQEPRVVEQDYRESCRIFFAMQGTYGLPPDRIQQCFNILETCEKCGIDPVFAAFRDAAQKSSNESLPAAPNATPVSRWPLSDAFNQVVQEFRAGKPAADVAREAIKLIPALPPVPRNACIVLAMVCSVRAGDHARARQLAVRHHRDPTCDPCGLPTRIFGPAVFAERSVAPVREELQWMDRGQEGTQEERDAIRALIAEYTKEEARYFPAK